jgi:hypothetical protein
MSDHIMDNEKLIKIEELFQRLKTATRRERR